MKRKDRVPVYYPISLNLSGKKCVVVGGGEVALRKVRALLEHGGNVLVISPELCSALVQLSKSTGTHVLNREYRAGDLDGAFTAIAATGNLGINRQVMQEARKRAVLVNIVDDAENSDFIVPSHLRRGDVTIAISTAGRSPSLARKIRTKLEKDFGDEYATLALLINEVRAEVNKQGIKINGDVWQEVLDLDLLASLVAKGDNEKAKTILLSNLETQRTKD
jgi:siroheme synthase-like protein